MPSGRLTSHKEEYNDLAYKFSLLGSTDAQMADFFGVSEQTINAWKKVHPIFLESIKRGKEQADANIAHSLYHRAKGYSHKEDKVFAMGSDQEGNPKEPLIVETTKHYPPDTAAAFIWLKNRRRNWSDKTNRPKFHKGNTPTETADAIMQTIADGEMSAEIGVTLITALKSMVDIDAATEMKERIEAIEESLGVNSG